MGSEAPTNGKNVFEKGNFKFFFPISHTIILAIQESEYTRMKPN